MKKAITKEQSAKAAADFGAFMRTMHKELRVFTDAQIREAFPEIWTGWAMRVDFEMQEPA